MIDSSMKEHWNRIYSALDADLLGWYEKIPLPSLKLLSKCDINKTALILDVGVGASTFIDSLVEQEFTNIVATDISEIALSKLKERLGEEKASLVRWIADDITRPAHIQHLMDVAVWHDRALLHFLVKDAERNMYLSTLKKVVKEGGYVIISAFSLKGAKECTGLDVRNYDQNLLAGFLGDDFELLEYFDFMYHMPSGELRPYIYTLFQRRQSPAPPI